MRHCVLLVQLVQVYETVWIHLDVLIRKDPFDLFRDVSQEICPVVRKGTPQFGVPRVPNLTYASHRQW
jgi:hypothetical protein